MEPKTIAKELKITQEQIEKFLDTKKNTSIPTNTSNTDHVDPELMIHRTTSNKNGVSIMTQQASAKGDDLNKKLNTTISRTAKNAIFRPRDN